MKHAIKGGSTDVTLYVFIADSASTTGGGKTGLVYNTSSLAAYYVRNRGTATAISLVTQTVTGAHSDGGFVEVDATNMPGVYRLDLPDAVCASGALSCAILLKGASGMAPCPIEIQVQDVPSDVNAISGSAVSATTAQLGVNVVQLSGDATAADNAESFFDGTGYSGTNNTLPTVTNLTNLPSAPTDWLTAAAVKADAVTKIQTGLATPTNITAGTITTVTNLTNAPSNGDFTSTMKSSITSAVPTAAAVADAVWDEDISGRSTAGTAGAQVNDIDTETDLIYAAVQGIGTSGGAAVNIDAATDNYSGGITGVTSATTKVGTQTNTYASTSNVNGVYHTMTHSGNAIDIVYQFLCGGGTTPISVNWIGYLDGSNDAITVAAWNHVGGAWETIFTIAGQATTTNITRNFVLYSRHSGTSAAELGKVYIRLYCTGQTSPVLHTDQLYVSYAVTSRSVGYSNGAVWVDTNNGVDGTELYVNGTADKPCKTLAEARTIAEAVGIKNIQVINGSHLTLANSYVNYTFTGDGYEVALGNQDVSETVFVGAWLSGTGTGTGFDAHYGVVGDATLPIGTHLHFMALSGTVTVGAAGDYILDQCYSVVAGDATGTVPTLDFVMAVGATNVSVRHHSGGIRIKNMTSLDKCSVDGDGIVVIDSGCTGGTLALHGNLDLVDQASGAVTVTDTARWNEDQSLSVVGNVTTKTGYALTSAYDPAKTAAQASTALTNATWTDVKAGYIDAAISSRNATTPPTVTAIRQEMDTNSTKLANLDATVSSRSTYAGGAVASVTGNVGGNVVGSVGSVTAAVTAGTVSDKTGYSLASAPPTAASIADAVWDEALSGHTGAGSAGNALSSASSGNVDTAALADAIWDEALSGHSTSGTAGKKLTDLTNADVSGLASATNLADLHTDVGTVLSNLATVDGILDNLHDMDIPAIKAETAAILNDTGTDGVIVASGSKTGYTLTSAYDAAKTAAQAGNHMDLVSAPNATAITAIQSGLATGANLSTVDTVVDTIAGNVVDIQSRIPSALVSGKISADVGSIAGSTEAASDLSAISASAVRGTVDTSAFSATTTAFETSITTATADYFNGNYVKFTSGALAGISSEITDYALVSGKGHFTVTALPLAPSNGDAFFIF